jgi:outer membrane cobalamin receptor
MPNLRISLIIAVFLCLATALSAQDKPRNFFRLDENDLQPKVDSGQSQVMAASRTLKDLDDLPVTVYIITREEILGNGYTTLVDALSSIPGIRVSQPGSASDGETFQIRGIYGNYYCKILVDGITVKPSEVSGMPIGRQLPIRQAERIEVIFGPASSVYGAEAMAGVINIVTHQSDRPVTAQADIALGSQGFQYLNVTIGGKTGRNKNVLTYSLFGGNSLQRDMNVKYDRGYLYNPSLYDSTYSYLSKPHYNGDTTSIVMNQMPLASNLLGLSFRWRGWTAQIMRMARSAYSSIGEKPTTYRYDNPENIWSEVIQRYMLSYEKKWNKVTSSSQFAWMNYRMNDLSTLGLLQNIGPSGNAYKYAGSDDILLEEQVNILPVKGLELVAGAMFQYSGNLPVTNDLSSPFNTDVYSPFSTAKIPDTSIFAGFGYNPVTFYRAGAYLQFFYQVKRFTIMGGLRTEYNSMFDFSHNPRIALMYRTNKNFSVRASFSTGHRVPAMYYMYRSEAYRQGTGISYNIVPNTNLQEEKLIAAEVGMRWKRLKWLDVDAALFYHKIYEQFTLSFVHLDSAEYPLAVNPYQLAQAYVNDENSMAQIFGLQADLSFKNLVRSINLQADLDMTISKGNEILPNNLGTINDYRQVPVFMGHLDLSLSPVERVRLNFRNNFSSGWVRGYLPLDPDILDQIGYPVNIKGYYSLDVRARFLIGKNFEAFAHFNNVTNTHYGGIDAGSDSNDLFYNPQYGFNFRIGFNFRME